MNPENEKMKKKYEKHLIGAETSAPTIDQYLRAINMLDLCNNYLGFKKYDLDQIIKFKENLRGYKRNGQLVSPRTSRTFILHVKKYFLWLCTQPGYKRTNLFDLIAYFKPNRLENNSSCISNITDYPDVEYVLKLCNSITVKCDLDLRDRALIAFFLLTGMRIGAVISLPFGNIDKDTLIIYQDPQKMNIKFDKNILSIVFRFDETLVGYISNYLKLLSSLKFKADDPLFPKPKIEYDSKMNRFKNPGILTRKFWKGKQGVAAMIEKRCNQAGLKYYSPHKYRHGTANMLYDYELNLAEAKAVSQAMGYKYLPTMLKHYGHFNEIELKSKLTNMKFDKKHIDNADIVNELAEIKKMLQNGIKNDR